MYVCACVYMHVHNKLATAITSWSKMFKSFSMAFNINFPLVTKYHIKYFLKIPSLVVRPELLRNIC